MFIIIAYIYPVVEFFYNFSTDSDAALLSDELMGAVIKKVVSNIHSDLESMLQALDQVLKNLKDLKIR